MQLKQSTAVNIPFFMRDSSDSISGKTGLSPTVTISKNGAGFVTPVGSVTEIGNGWYYLAAAATGANDVGTLGALLLHATATGADVWDDFHEVLVDVPGGAVASVTGNVGGNVVGSVASVSGAVGSVTGLTAANLDVAVSTRLAGGSYTAPPAAATIAQAVWDALTSALTTSGSIGKWIVDKLDVVVSTRNSVAPDNAGIASIKAKTDNLPAAPASASDVTTVGTAVAAVSTKLGTPASSVSADIAAVKAVDDAIKVKTDALPGTPASQGDVVWVETQIAALIGTPVATVSDDIAAVKANAVTLLAQTDHLTINKNSVVPNFDFLMVDDTNQLPATGLTVVAKRRLDGGSFALCANAVVEIGNGWYTIQLEATDTNASKVALEFSATGAETQALTIFTES